MGMLNIVLPMAGRGSHFADAWVPLKPLTLVQSVPKRGDSLTLKHERQFLGMEQLPNEDKAMNNEAITLLTGYSGCVLWLYASPFGKFVRKISGTADYDRRLRRQCAKQARFRSDILETPRVLRHGTDVNGRFFFDMEYVAGFTLAERMEEYTLDDIDRLEEILFAALPVDLTEPTPDAHACFTAKITELRRKIPQDMAVAVRALDVLERYDFSCIPHSNCCGDLTLENIIVRQDGRLYLIDLLDSFYDSWQLDVAKLLQDLELHWSWRRRGASANLIMRLTEARNRLVTRLLALPDGETVVRQVYYLLLLTLARIYPYVRDLATAEFLDNATAKVMTQLDKWTTRRSGQVKEIA
jgi:hypothetical protein